MTAPDATSTKTLVREAVEGNKDRLVSLSRAIHDEPELCFEEARAAERVAALLEESGFDVERGAYGLPTAVRATTGPGPLSVVICAEYDALPAVGHACGHNLIAAAAVGAGAGAGLDAVLGGLPRLGPVTSPLASGGVAAAVQRVVRGESPTLASAGQGTVAGLAGELATGLFPGTSAVAVSGATGSVLGLVW